jgi:hypothetical protein
MKGLGSEANAPYGRTQEQMWYRQRPYGALSSSMFVDVDPLRLPLVPREHSYAYSFAGDQWGLQYNIILSYGALC